MIGIDFQIPRSYGTIIKEILDGIDVEQYTWHLSEGDSLQATEPDTSDSFSERFDGIKTYDGKVFKELINQQDCLIMFANMKAFPKPADVRELKDYKEYVHSNCQLVFLIADVTYAQIYAKNKEELEVIKKNVIRCGGTDIEDVTEENDGRTGFSVS